MSSNFWLVLYILYIWCLPSFNSYLNNVLLFWDCLIWHLETERILHVLHQEQITTLGHDKRGYTCTMLFIKTLHSCSCSDKWSKHCSMQINKKKKKWFITLMTHKNVCAVDEMLHPLFCNEQHFIKEEEGSLLFNPLNPEGAFQNQLSKAAEIRTSPV